MNIIKKYAITIAAALGVALVSSASYADSNEVENCKGSLKKGDKLICTYKSSNYTLEQMYKFDECIANFLDKYKAVDSYETELDATKEMNKKKSSEKQQISYSLKIEGNLLKLSDEQIKQQTEHFEGAIETACKLN